MSITDAILATLASEPGSESGRSGRIHGRTMVQKKVYFLSVLCDEEFGFRPHYFGPYSSQVSTSLSALVEAGFVEETRTGYGVPGPFGEVVRFDYRLTEPGIDVVQSDPSLMERYSAFLARINDEEVISDLKTMAIAAKVHFIVSYRREATIDLIRKEAELLGWELSKNEVDGVIRYLKDSLGVVHAEKRRWDSSEMPS